MSTKPPTTFSVSGSFYPEANGRGRIKTVKPPHRSTAFPRYTAWVICGNQAFTSQRKTSSAEGRSGHSM